MKLTIIGASGHGKVAADIAKLNGYDEICFLDDDETIKECGGYPVVGKTDKSISGPAFIAIGDPSIRERLSGGRELVTLIHPSAVIADDVVIGNGTLVTAAAVINPGTVIGRSCIINTSSSIDHDCRIGDYAHISVGAHLCGTVSVGRESWIAAGATVSNNINICEGCVVAAGAVVVRDLTEPGIYMGVPAKLTKRGK